MKMFSPHAYLGYAGRHDDEELYRDDLNLVAKFYRKYPEVKYFPQATTVHVKFGGTIAITHPAAVFTKKQRALIKKGYTEEKAFEIVEKDLYSFIN